MNRKARPQRINTFFNVFFWIGVLLAVLLLISAGLTYVYRQDLAQQIKQKIESTFHLHLDYQQVRFNYFTKPGELTLSLEQVQCSPFANTEPGKVEALLNAQSVHFSLNLGAVLQGKYTIEKVYVENAQLNLLSSSAQQSNFEALFNQSTAQISKADWQIKRLSFQNVALRYRTAQENFLLEIVQLIGTLDPTQAPQPHFAWQGKLSKIQLYANNQLFWEEDKVAFTGTTDYQTSKNLLTLSNAQCQLKETNFLVQGSYHFAKARQHEVDFTFTGKNKDLGQIFAFLPAAYYKEWQGFYSQGLVNFQGTWKGIWRPQKYPQLAIDFNAQNISIHSKHHVRRSITDLSFEGSLQNGEEQSLASTTLRIAKVSGKLANKAFKADFLLSNLRNPHIALYAEAGIDLAYWQEFYPLRHFQALKGLLGFKVNFDGEWAALTSQQAANNKKIMLGGLIELVNLDFQLRNNPLHYQDIQLRLDLRNNEALIKQAQGKVGNTDFRLEGTLLNLPAYLSNQTQLLNIEGKLFARKIDLDELLRQGLKGIVAQNPTYATSGYHFQAPENISFDLDCSIDSLTFRRFRANTVKGGLSLKEKVFKTHQLHLKTAGGDLYLLGLCNAQQPNFIRFDGRLLLQETRAEAILYTCEDFSQDFIRYSQLKGSLNADLKLGLVFDQYLSIQTPHLVADIESQLTKGEIKDLVLLNDIAKKLQINDLAPLPLEEMKNSIQIRNQTLFIAETEIISPKASLSLIGRATPDKGLDFQLKVPLKQNFVNPEVSAVLQSDQRATYYLRLKGKANNWKVNYIEIEDKTQLEPIWEKEKQAYLRLFKSNALSDIL